MESVRSETSNAIFVLDGCNDLPVTVITQEDGQKVIETCWALSPEELALVAKTGLVYVQQLSFVPPMKVEAVSTTACFKSVEQ